MTTKLIAADACQQSAGRENHQELLELIDAYAEARHIGGCHTYNAKTAEARAKVIARLAASAGSEAVAPDGWLHEKGLLYRLTDERHPCNRDEINVTMADGSRSIEARSRRALELLDRIRATPSAADTTTVPEGWTDADADAARLALELECLLTDTKDQAVVSKWWASAHDALELHRARLASPQTSPTPQADSQTALEITAPNASGSTQCTVRWQVETPKGWAGAWDREVLEYLIGRAPADSVPAVDASPSAASVAWSALRDLTDPLGEDGMKIMGHVRIYAQRQYEAGLAARAPADSVTAPADGAVAGWKLAPVEPTDAMVQAAHHIDLSYMPGQEGADRAAIYRAMLAAAPTPPAPPADSVLEDAARLERARICAAIKAEDDYCVDQGDYMLDSDDCIKIVRGEWVRPDFAVDAARKQGGA